MAIDNNRGFTLIELMIVVAIVAILAAVALPAYQNSVLKSNRTDAKAALMSAAAMQEQRYFQFNQYTGAIANVGGAASPEGHYTLSVSVDSGDTGCASDGRCYLLTATATGSQARDTDCAVFTVSHTGAKAALTSTNADNTDLCW